MVDEFEAVQNNALGGLLLWGFVNGFYKETEGRNGPILPLIMLVLPMVFNQQTVKVMCNKNHIGGLYRSLEEDKTIIVGLQDRMEEMVEQTFKSLNIAFASGLIEYETENSEIILCRRSEPFEVKVSETKKLINVSKKIGRWFSEMTINEICALLKVRF